MKEPLVEIAVPGVVVDLAYAGSGNLAGRPLYRDGRAWAHRDMVPLLVKAVQLASLAGVQLKVLDAYRPPAAHEALCAHITDPRYIADPKRGSNHSRGTAIDLTLVDGEGRELDMGTAFDAMVEASHHFHPALEQGIHRNRFLLLGILGQAGFRSLAEEWWHYELPDARSYPLIQSDDLA